MFIDVRELELRPAEFAVELAPGEIDFLDAKIRQAGPLKAAGKAELVLGSLEEIRVRGHVSVVMEADCDRCLEPAKMPVDSDFELYYRPVAEGYGSDMEVGDEEAEMGFYEGEGLELNEVLREYVSLALPMQRVCSESCRGICPVCGQNRNLKDCDCHVEATDDRWAALKMLKK
ncbi:MAG: DUF177 domain-containing protein [Bryobacteraceae bacterium]